MSSPPPTDTNSNNDTTDFIEEFQDDRPQQDQLVEGSARASANTDSRIDEGGSDEFVDDRPNVCNSTEDTSKQATLGSEMTESQTDLTGSQPTEDSEYLDGGTRESALDALAEGSWNPSTISRAFDVTGNVANSIMEMGPDASHVLKVEDNTDDLTEWPGIGDASASSIRSTIPLLQSRGITRYGLPLSADDNSSGGRNEWTGAVEYLRELYSDTYDDRITLSNDLMDHGAEEGLDVPQSVGGEAVTQPLIRYQDIPPEDAWTQIMNSVGQREADQIRELLVSFATTERETGNDVDDETIYDKYPVEDITQESLREHFGAAVSNRSANRLSEEYGDIKSLSGAVGGQLEATDGVGSATLQELFGTEDPDEDRTVAHTNRDDDGEDLKGVESVTEQTVMEGIVGSLDVPELWMIVDEHEDAERDPSILVEHPDGYLAEMWLRGEDVPSGAGKWDIEYVDPVGTRRDGSGQFHESAQDALDELVPHIKEVRAEERDRAEQQAEQEDVDWPETIGRFRLREQTASDTHAEYRTDYLSGYGILGTKRQERSEDIRFYDDIQKYHFMDESYAWKEVAIEAAEEELTDLTETLNEREDEVIEQNDIPDHVLPHRYRDDLDDDQDDGGDDITDNKPRQMGISPDDTDQLTVDICFAAEGISASVYAISETPNRADLLKEAWYTWAEVDDLITDMESHITVEIPVQHSENGNEDALLKSY